MDAKTLQCPACGAPFDPAQKTCSYCGQRIHIPEFHSISNEARLPAWTQGLSPQGSANGNYDVVEHEPKTLAEVMAMLHTLPIPPADKDPGDFAPPTIGFGERNVSRNPDGSYFLWPEDRNCNLQDAETFLKKIFEGW